MDFQKPPKKFHLAEGPDASASHYSVWALRLSPALIIQLLEPCKAHPFWDWFHVAPGNPLQVFLCPWNRSYSQTSPLLFLSYLIVNIKQAVWRPLSLHCGHRLFPHSVASPCLSCQKNHEGPDDSTSWSTFATKRRWNLQKHHFRFPILPLLFPRTKLSAIKSFLP